MVAIQTCMPTEAMLRTATRAAVGDEGALCGCGYWRRSIHLLSPQTDQIGATRTELPFTSSVLMAACFPSQKENCQPS